MATPAREIQGLELRFRSLEPSALYLRGIISILFGIIAFSWPGPSLLAIVLLYGVYAFADGVLAIASAYRQGRRHERWGLPVLEGVLGVGAGIITFIWPGITLLGLSILVGIWAIATGITELAAAFKLRTAFRQTERSPAGRVFLGIAGVASIVLGLFVFAFPSLGTVALLTLVAAYSLIFGALMIALGANLHRQRSAQHEVVPPTRRAA